MSAPPRVATFSGNRQILIGEIAKKRAMNPH
jgi:hypothetical protein